MDSLIKVKNVSKFYASVDKEISVLEDINFNINNQEFVAIMGASGSGKSTLLSLLAGLDRPSTGEILVEGLNICAFNERKLAEYRNKKVGMVFQNYNLITSLNAIENIKVPLYLNHNKIDIRKRASELLSIVGMENKGYSSIAQLSGGEQQRVAIARALSCNPILLLADEPTGALDSINSTNIINLFRDLNTNLGMTIIMVTHDYEIAKKSDRIIYIKDGFIRSY
ncbi:TPA: ABC transporter ATP-binding protein [Streptococcus pyogenes]